MDRHHALPFKVLKRLADALLLALLLAVTSLSVALMPAHSQEVIYQENFNDGQAQGWDLEPGWRVADDMLVGSGHKWARYTAGTWEDFRVSFRLQIMEEGSVIHLNYRYSDWGRYFVGLHAGGLYLSKEAPWGTFDEDLDRSYLAHSYRDWHSVEIAGKGPRIQVIINGKMELDYTDPEPLLSGTIAFETLDGALVHVDDIAVEVIGPPSTRERPGVWTFQGRVYESDVGDETHPLHGVTVSVYGSYDHYPTRGKFIRKTTTNSKGWYGLNIYDDDGPYEFYHIQQTNQPGYTSVGATSVDGTVRTPNWIEYSYPIEDKTLTGNKFWDRRSVPKKPVPPIPHVESVHPSQGRCGTEMILTVSGANFAPGTNVSILEGVNTRYTKFINSGELKVGIYINPETKPGPRPVKVIGPEGPLAILEEAFTVFCQKVQPDLVLHRADREIIEKGRWLVIGTLIENAGDVLSPETIVQATTQAADWVGTSIVPELDKEERIEVSIRLPIHDKLRGRSHPFRVVVDPRNEIAEQREGNNRQVFEVWVPPPPNLGLLILTVVVVVSFTIGGITLTIRTRRRRNWQKKAKDNEPSKTCKPCTHHCRKVVLELEPALHKVTHLTLGFYGHVSGDQSKERQVKVKGEVVDILNSVVRAYRLSEKSETLQEKVAPLVHALLQQIRECLPSDSVSKDVSIAGHLEGGKVNCQFILYHCKRRGTVNIWEEEDKWKATIKDELDEPVGTLRRLDPAEPGIAKRLEPELTQLLMQFIEKV